MLTELTINNEFIVGTTNITLHTARSSFIGLMLQDIMLIQANLVCACARVLMTTGFPPPVGATTMVVCRSTLSHIAEQLCPPGERRRERKRRKMNNAYYKCVMPILK